MPLTKPKLVIVLGPTAVGKSELALELAPQIDGEIVNADSQQVYRYMDIGTGKPSEAERKNVKHHLIDVVNPDEEFNAALYRRLATEAIDRIQREGKTAVVCGGTGSISRHLPMDFSPVQARIRKFAELWKPRSTTQGSPVCINGW